MKNVLIVLIAILFVSCERQNIDSHDAFLEYHVKQSYDYYFSSTFNLSIENSYIADVLKLKDYAEQAIKNSSDEGYYNDFEILAYKILNEYSSDKKNADNYNLLDNSIKSSIETRVRLLEYFVLNTMIKYIHNFIYNLNAFNINIIPNNPVVRQGDDLKAEIYVTFDNSFNPIEILVDGEKLRTDSGSAHMYKYRTSQKGKFSTDAELLITQKGEKLSVPFVINYEVK